MQAMSILDASVISNFPLVCAMHESPLPRPQGNGMRFIAAADGMYREVQTEWMRRIKRISAFTLPYGEIAECLEFHIAPPPLALWREFINQSIVALPNEHAALMVWNTSSQSWRLVERGFTHASAAKIDYVEPVLAEDDLAVIDIHSHARARAFFSGTDNRDDRGGIKIAACVGHVHTQNPEVVMRVACIDEFIPIQFKAGKFEVQQRNETLHTETPID